MVAGSSSEWLPPGFEERIEVKNGRKIRCYYDVATGMQYNSKKDAMVYLKTQEIFHDPQEINNDENGLSFKNEVDEFLVETNKSPEWLPNGWRMEEKPRKKGTREGSNYKIYIDLSTGNKFYSRLAVARYLKNVDLNDGMVEQPKLDNLGEPLAKPDTPLRNKSLTEAGYIPEKVLATQKCFTGAAIGDTSAGEQTSSETDYIPGRKKKGKFFSTVLDNAGVTLTLDVPLECKPMSDDDCIPKTRKRKHSFMMVASEITIAEGLPPGWIKEIRTSKSGNKIRKDPYYVDPVNGYIFHSKKDALRYLETNDISSCAIIPKRQKLVENTTPPMGNQQCKPRTDDDCIADAEMKKNSKQSFPTSANESTNVEGLPPGWIKEVQTRKSGSKIKKDNYYIDPVNGYMFRSKKNVMRYLETNDIGSCAITTKRMELNGPKLIKNKIHHLSPTDQKLPDHHEINEKLFSGGESKIHGGNNSGVKTRAALKTRISKIAISGGDCVQDSPTVATESTEVDGLPPGWVKEIKTSKSGKKIRRDPSSSPSKRKLSDHLGTKLVSGEESSGNGGESSSHGSLAASKAEITNTTVAVANGLQDSTAVAPEITPADGLPPGWTREIKTIKSGNRIRKDPFFTPTNGKFSGQLLIPGVDSPDIKSGAASQVASEITSADGLPPGWMKEIKTSKSGNKMRKDLSLFPSNRKFSDILETKDKLFCVGRSNISGEDSLRVKSLSTSKAKSSKIVFAGADSHSFKDPTMVASEITSADGLPPGWLKEIKICKSGDKIRKDPYYTDPVSGFIFRSKKDALRYLETNDIRSCAIRPKKRVSEDLKLINGEAPPSSPSNGKFSDHLETKDNLFYGGRSNISGEDSSGFKSLSTSMAKSSKAAFAGADSYSFEDPTMVASEITSADWLPPGWLREIKIRKSGDKIRKDPYYTDPVSGYVFRSRKGALRFLETNDIGSCAIRLKKTESDDLKLINNEANSLSPANQKLPDHIETQPKLFSGGEFNGGGDSSSVKSQAESKAEISNTTFAGTNSPQNPTTVSVEITLADGLPPGWMKEVKTSYSGNKIRKDPLYYIDPVDGYIFRSRKDVLRFLETNDIGSCTMRPMKRKSDDHKLMKNKNNIAVATKSKLFSGGELKSGVGDSVNVECLAESKAKISRFDFDGASTFTSSDSILRTKIGPEQTNTCSEQGLMAEVLDICSVINESSTEEKLPESGTEKRTGATRLRPRKSVKIRDLNLLSRASKRFSNSEPEMISHMDLNEQPLGVPVENSSVYRLPSQSGLLQEKKFATPTLSGKAPLLEDAQLNKDGNLPSQENDVFHRDEKLLAENKVILTGHTEEKANGNGLKPSYAFGESWTDPCLQFAFNTLTGEITIEETPSSPGIPENQEGQCMVRAEHEVTTMFESDIPPGFETMEQNRIADKLPADSSFFSSLAGSSMFQVDEFPPGFELVVQNSAIDKFPLRP